MSNQEIDSKTYQKIYRKENKEKLDLLKKEQYKCLNCGRSVQHCNQARHEVTKYCIKRTPKPIEYGNTAELVETILAKMNDLQNIINLKK